ncbi:hypothetical protein JXA12_04120 [Candidatus Woesearchaeota archaeon]|nr:hypothetical protein [Candidatus Woesearchaeota archaeon]
MVIYCVDGRFLDGAKQDAAREEVFRAVCDELDGVLSRYGCVRTSLGSWVHVGADAVFCCSALPRSPRA